MKTINLKIDERIINRASECKFVGSIKVENLTWKPHINFITNKIYKKNIVIMFKVGQCLTKKVINTLYYSLVYPYIHNCNISWANNYRTRLSRIVTLQKGAVRNVSLKIKYGGSPVNT